MGFPNLSPELRLRLEQLRRQAALTRPPRLGTPAATAGTWERVWSFPDAEAADRWNAEWEACLEVPHALPQALVTLGRNRIPDPGLDALVRLGASVVRDDIEHGSPCPFVRPGWSYALSLRIEPYPSHNPNAQHGSVARVLGLVRDEHGEVLWSCDGSRHLPFDLVPPGVAALWQGRRWPQAVEVYS